MSWRAQGGEGLPWPIAALDGGGSGVALPRQGMASIK